MLLMDRNTIFCWVGMLRELNVFMTMKCSKSFSSDCISAFNLLNWLLIIFDNNIEGLIRQKMSY